MLVRKLATKIAAPKWPAITVPSWVVSEIVRLARRGGEVTLRSDGRLLEARGGSRTLACKLIGERFPPDYDRLIPSVAAGTASFAAADMVLALARLEAAASRERPAVGLSWDGGAGLGLCLAREEALADDVISAETTGASQIALSIESLTKAIEAIGADRLRLSHEQRPGVVVRLDVPEDDGAVAIIAPVHWSAAAA
jgi:DNA polymerase III sliding clamp (beta) subunit (PCNA family)